MGVCICDLLGYGISIQNQRERKWNRRNALMIFPSTLRWDGFPLMTNSIGVEEFLIRYIKSDDLPTGNMYWEQIDMFTTVMLRHYLKVAEEGKTPGHYRTQCRDRRCQFRRNRHSLWSVLGNGISLFYLQKQKDRSNQIR